MWTGSRSVASAGLDFRYGRNTAAPHRLYPLFPHCLLFAATERIAALAALTFAGFATSAAFRSGDRWTRARPSLRRGRTALDSKGWKS